MSAPSEIDRWLSDYVDAWSTDSAEAVAALFTPDARYFTAPFRAPIVGATEISAWWTRQGESKLRWTFDHEVIAREGDLYVVRGTTTYPEGSASGSRREVFRNLWLVTLAPDGRAREFIEYWMLEE